jgi:NADH-quinone oxidoreductase subunit N
VISAVLDIGMTWLAALAVLLSVVGAYYYLRVVKLMYFDEAEGSEPLAAGGAFRLVLSLNGIAILALGLFPGLLLALCAWAIA